MSETNTNLLLGDIVKIYAPSNSKINEKMFLITFINSQKVKLVSDDIDYELQVDANQQLTDESITYVQRIYRNPAQGYIAQNKLLMNSWIDIHFTGDLPFILTGQISNIEEDMMELTVYPSEKRIYIDFAYTGIPENLNIQKIIRRKDAPQQKIPVTRENEEKEEEESEQGENYEENQDIEEGQTGQTGQTRQVDEDIVEDDENVVIEVINPENESIMEAPAEEYVIDDEEVISGIVYGEDMPSVQQYVNVSERERRFGIDIQESDLFNTLLSSFTIEQQTDRVVRSQKKMTTRFKELWNQYSNFDDNQNPYEPKFIRDNTLPTTYSQWIIPVVTNKKKVYNVPIDELQLRDDVLLIDHDLVSEEIDNMNIWTNEDMNSVENLYEDYKRNLEYMFTPFVEPMETDFNQFLTAIKSSTAARICIAENFDNYTSSGVEKDYKLFNTRFQSYRYHANDPMHIRSFLHLNQKFYRDDGAYSNILRKSNSRPSYHIEHLRSNDIDVVEIEMDDLSNNRNNYLFNNDKHVEYKLSDEALNDVLLYDDAFDSYVQYQTPSANDCLEYFGTSKNSFVSQQEAYHKLNKYNFDEYNIRDGDAKKIHELLDTFTRNFMNTFKENSFKHRNYRKRMSTLQFEDSDASVLEPVLDTIMYNEKNNTLSENIQKQLTLESARTISNQIAKENVNLLFIGDIEKDLKYFQDKYTNDDGKVKPPEECPRLTISHKYSDVNDLYADNDVDLYYQQEQDDTIYDIIDVYKNEKETMEEDEFSKYLIEKLQSVNGLKEEDAIYNAETLIAGKRRVRDGDYGILIDFPDEEPTSDTGDVNILKFFKRSNNKWVLDEEVTTKHANSYGYIMSGNVCILQEKCVNIEDDCKNTSSMRPTIKMDIIQRMKEEYNHKLYVSKENAISQLEKDYDEWLYKTNKYNNIREKEKVKYHYFQQQLGKTYEDVDVIISPYAKAFDQICGTNDFSIRNQDIYQFSQNYTRIPFPLEEKGWLYCKESNIKLVPEFMFELASAYVNKRDYKKALRNICLKQGVISEDGDAWVDSKTGYVIKKIDFVGEYETQTGNTDMEDEEHEIDNYDDNVNAIVIDTDIMQEERANDDDNDIVSENIVVEEASEEVDNEANYANMKEDDFINDMIDYLESKKLHLNANNEDENMKHSTLIAHAVIDKLSIVLKEADIHFIVFNAVNIFDNLHSNTKSKRDLLLFTISLTFLSIQLSGMSSKSKKTFPGCVVSFDGFPLHEGESKGLDYIACVLEKLSKDSMKRNPFSVLKKFTQLQVKQSLHHTIEHHLLTKSSITNYIKQRRENNAKESQELETNSHCYQWSTYLPILCPFTMKTVTNFTSDFFDQLRTSLGNGTAHSMILKLRSKNINLSYAVLNEIQKVIQKEKMLLTTLYDEPFLENACCHDSKQMYPFRYFAEREKMIYNYQQMMNSNLDVYEYHSLLLKPPQIYGIPNELKQKFPFFGHSDYIEKNIYKAFLHYCKWNMPKNDRHLLRICKDSDNIFKDGDSFESKVEKMKSAGKVYNSKMLKYLMMKIATRNSIHYKNDNKENLFVSKFETFQECMQNIDNFSHVPTNFYEFIERLDKLTNVYSVQINIDELQTSKEYMQIRSFLYEAITQNFEKVNSFMTEHSDSSADDTSDLKDFLYQLTAFDKSSYNTKTINGVHIDKNYMVNVVEYIKNTSREFATVFPNKICNKTKIFYGTGSKVDPYVFPRSKTWDFSGFHLGDLKKAFSEYSKYLEVFYTQNDDGINFNTIMKEFSLKVETIRIFIENTPLLFAGMKNDELQISVFYEDTLFMIYTFYFSELLNLIIDVSESTIVDEN
jgi:hypothetical protein